MALEIKNISKTYDKKKKVLSGITLTIGKGMFGLLGHNGTGKSTLMRIIATLQDPDWGSIAFDDIDVLKQPEKMRKIRGYLPQDFGVYHNVTAFEMLHHLAKMKGMANKQQRNQAVEELFHRVNCMR